MTKNKLFYTTLVSALSLSLGAYATEINTNTAIMQAMDKITGHVSLVEVPVNQEVKFGTFSILVRECKTRTPEETPENFAFVDIVDATPKGNEINIFKGWMISSSPALNAVAHPVYDVWLLKCTDKNVDTKLQMNKEELADRDTIEMKRQQAIMVLEEVAKSENIVENNGEPIDLIPASITENNEDNKTEDTVVGKTEEVKSENMVAETDSNISIIENTPKEAATEIKETPAPAEDGAPEALVVIQEEKTTVAPKDEYEVIEDVVVIKNEQEQKNLSDNEIQNVQNEMKEQVAEVAKKVEENTEKAIEETNEHIENIAKETTENIKQKVDEEINEKVLTPEEIISQLEKELSAKAISE